MEKNEPKISVIVPVYKAERYLHKCVDSLLAQTFTDFEVILVDDGSPDRSGELCDEYAHRDSRVQVIHKENGGVSSARQCGMDHARGEYTIHADPDDWVEPTMLEELYRKAREEDADMVICDFYEDCGRKEHYIQQRPSLLDIAVVQRELFQQLHGSCWNKLVRRTCYSRFDVSFPLELSYCEDLYVNVCLLAHPIRVTYLHKAFYHYVRGENGNSLVANHDDSQERFLMKFLPSLLPEGVYERYALPQLATNMAMSLFMKKDITSSRYRLLVKPYRKALLRYEYGSALWKWILYVSSFRLKGPLFNFYQRYKQRKNNSL